MTEGKEAEKSLAWQMDVFGPASRMASPTLSRAVAAPACLSAAECTAELIVFFQLEREILRYEAAWLAGVPYWDAKLKIGEHLLEDAQHGEALLKRLHELKAASAEHKQTPGVDEILRAFSATASGDEWLHGLYGVLKPWLAAQLRGYLAQSDPLMDVPTHQAIRRILFDLDLQIAWFAGYTPVFSPWEQPEVGAWLARLRTLAGSAAVSGGQVSGLKLEEGNRTDFTAFPRVRRDRTFRVAAVRDPKYTATADQGLEDRRFAIFYNHTQEMQFAESLGAVLFETAEMPWAYHHDIARHISDEVRHSRMGQERLEQLGHRLADMPMLIHNYEFRTHMDPLERFCLMTLVMEASGFEVKRANIAFFKANQDEVSVRYADYDVRDEMLHVNLGHAWVPIMLRVYHDSRSVTETVEHCRTSIAGLTTEYPTAARRV
jgi:hypothetical protein